MGSFSFKSLLGAVALCLLTTPAMAIVSNLTPTADNDIQLFGGTNIDTTDTIIAFTQSGGLVRNAIFEFDLSSIPDTATINSASLDMTLTRFVSNLGPTAEIDIFGFAGDGAILEADFSTAGTQLFDGTTASGGVAGDVRSFALDPASFFESILATDLLTIRIETDSFASINIASLENQTFDPLTLNIDFTADDTPVPAPAMAPLFAGGLGLLGLAGWRRRRLDA